ncbi:MAG: alpha-galactosidase [Selenomonadaceae bacterium]|nr:alpha-galactosidase [Selenomonadaceae bacterium]
MGITYNAETQQFHLFNDRISYLMKVLRNNQIGQLYFGQRVPDNEDYSYLVEESKRPMSSYVFEGEYGFSLEHMKQEYPSHGSTDFRIPAFEILQPNGSRITNFIYKSHQIYSGKSKLAGLPATYVENDDEADTLEIVLCDELINVEIILKYTIFKNFDAIARSVEFKNCSDNTYHIMRAMSLSLDLPDADYDFVQFSGWWSRERYRKDHRLAQGIQSIGSLRGHSSHVHNPFIILKRPNTDEAQGEAVGCSLIYSGNFLAQAEVDTFNVTRLTIGINPFQFDWQLKSGETFQTPEAVLVYSSSGLNALSQTYHKLYRTRLAHGIWRDRERPILINNWEATYFDFTEDKLINIAKTAKDVGVEMFVLDDGWFGTRTSDTSGLGDWWANKDRLPNDVKGIAEKINALDLKFGLWFELEMANKDSELYRNHPDWILHVPNRRTSHGRNQYVLDFSRIEVVDYIYDLVAKILRSANIEYIKWDMNRSITECYSVAYPAEQQGEIFHRYILGVYDLYERLTNEFPHILFESCASGGGRFDPGMLYYAPQAWTSDDSDGVERIKIQYGTSYVYPVSSMGAHVSVTPNHQLFRNTPLKLRGDVAYFGTFGYELDLSKLSDEELAEVKEQIKFMKRYRNIIQHGTFYRLKSPFDGNIAAWLVVSEKKKTAIVGYYKVLNDICSEYRRIKLFGLDESRRYEVSIDDKTVLGTFSGSELMNIGLITTDFSAGESSREEGQHCTDFWSRIYVIKMAE